MAFLSFEGNRGHDLKVENAKVGSWKRWIFGHSVLFMWMEVRHPRVNGDQSFLAIVPLRNINHGQATCVVSVEDAVTIEFLMPNTRSFGCEPYIISIDISIVKATRINISHLISLP